MALFFQGAKVGLFFHQEANLKRYISSLSRLYN